MTDFNPGVKLSLVRVGRPPAEAVWDVLAISDTEGKSFADDLRNADPANHDATNMLAELERRVPDHGPNFTNKTRCRPLRDNILEFKHGAARVLWFYDAGEPKVRRRIICSHLFYKQGRRTPPHEIEHARKRRARYLEAKARGDLVVPGTTVLSFRGRRR